VQRLVPEEAAHVVEVLPASEYEDEHIPGAIRLAPNSTTCQQESEDCR
jgi:rhodanese-related sulfurtransferase